MEMLQQRGLGGFSVRGLATGLGVDSMALYRHVRNKDDLLGAAVARALQAARPAGDGAWWEQAAHVFREHRRVVRAHPWVLAVMLSYSVESSEPWGGVDELLRVLQPRLGSSGAARWVRLLAAFTNGFLLSEPDVVDVPNTAQLEADYPRVMAAAARAGRRGDRDFEAGLGVLVDAMRADAAARPSLRTTR